MDRPPSRKHAKAPESVAAQRFPALIVSSHAGGHWFESSSLHQKSPGISTVSVHKDVFSYERLVATSVMEAAAFSLSMVNHDLDNSAIASISFMVARSTSPTPVK